MIGRKTKSFLQFFLVKKYLAVDILPKMTTAVTCRKLPVTSGSPTRLPLVFHSIKAEPITGALRRRSRAEDLNATISQATTSTTHFITLGSENRDYNTVHRDFVLNTFSRDAAWCLFLSLKP